MLDAAKHGTDPGLQNPCLDGFDHVVVRSAFEPEHDVHVVAPCGHHDDRHLALRANPATHLQPAYAGQHQIEHHDVRQEGRQPTQPLLTGLSRRNIVPLVAQCQTGAFTDSGVVFDEEDTRHALSISGGPRSAASLLHDDHMIEAAAVQSPSRPFSIVLFGISDRT